ncbi:MAG TPA: cation:proton antiporter [Candidatus Saccharimonadales bacterium]
MQIYLYLFILGGLALAAIFNFSGVQNEQWYLLTVAALLAIGLYSSTFGIPLQDARAHIRTILKAVTIGVLLKALIIGSVMTVVLKSPVGFILGIIVAQIDPLATAALMKGNRMSKRAQAILRAWSSFDDPMTVIMSLYAPALVAMITGSQWHVIQGSAHDAGLAGYLLETGVNLLFAVGVYVLWRLMKRHSKATNYVVIALIALGMYGLLAGALTLAVYYFWMLGIAVLGLFMRPPIEKAIDYSLHWALSLAAVLLGILLFNGINIRAGVTLGFAAYSAQAIVGFLLTRKLPGRDRWHIAFAQQNGITAIILALLFESYYPGTIAIAAPAILVINAIHAAANKALDIYLEKDFKKLTVAHHIERLKAHIHKI